MMLSGTIVKYATTYSIVFMIVVLKDRFRTEQQAHESLEMFSKQPLKSKSMLVSRRMKDRSLETNRIKG